MTPKTVHFRKKVFTVFGKGNDEVGFTILIPSGATQKKMGIPHLLHGRNPKKEGINQTIKFV